MAGDANCSLGGRGETKRRKYLYPEVVSRSQGGKRTAGKGTIFPLEKSQEVQLEESRRATPSSGREAMRNEVHGSW